MMRTFSALTMRQGDRCLLLPDLRTCDLAADAVNARVVRVDDSIVDPVCILIAPSVCIVERSKETPCDLLAIRA